MPPHQREVDLEDVKAALKVDLLGRTFETFSVQQVDVCFDEDVDGEWALYVTLTLTDPAGPTWPIDQVLVLRRRVRELAQPLVPDTPLYVLLSPEHEEPQADDEDETVEA